MKSFSALALLLLASVFQAGAQGLQPAPMDPDVRYGKLSNGLTYYIRHNEQPKERAEFFIAQKVGAILEEDNQNGLAHFLEHMCFNGTKNYPGKNFLNGFEKFGVKFGQNINAYTSLDETVYNLSEVPVTRDAVIDSALMVLHDWSNFVTLDGKEIDSERGVIREEWRQRRTAAFRVMQARNKAMLAGSKYAIRDVIGDTAVINNFTYEELRSYYRKWYRPDLQAILIVGDIDVDKIEARIKALFSDIPAQANPAERVYFDIPENEQPIVGVFTDPEVTSTTNLMFWKRKALPDEFRLSVQGYGMRRINNLMSFIINERMRNICQEPNSPFGSAGGGVSDLVRTEDAILFQCAPVAGKEKEARERMLKEAEIIRRYGFTESELERAKTSILSSYEKAYKERNQQKNNSLVTDFVDHFTSATPIPGITWEYEMVQKILPTVSVQVLNQVVKAYMPDKNFVYTITGPEKAGLVYPTNDELQKEIADARAAKVEPYKEEVSSEPLIPSMPKAGKVKTAVENKEIGVTEWTLSNGIRVILKPTKFKDDEILMNAWSKGGLSLVKTEDIPSAEFMPSVMKQSGLGTFTATELNKKLSGKIASVGTDLDNYEETVTGNSSVKDLETMLQLTYLTFTAPRKDQNAFDQVMKQISTYLGNTKGNPQKDYSDTLSLVQYNFHPRIFTLNEATQTKINFETIHRIYSERFGNPADFTFSFVGNIDPATFKPLVELYLGGLKTSKKTENWKDQGIRNPKGQIRKDIARDLKVSKTSNTIRYTAEMPCTMNNIVDMRALAAILDLRYTEVMREKEGATYGVSVGGNVVKEPIQQGIIGLRFDTDPKVEEKMLNIVQTEIDTIAMNGPKDEDLNKVRLNMLKQYKEDLEENGFQLDVIKEFYKNNFNYLKEYDAAVNAMSKQTIQAKAAELNKQGNRMIVLLKPKQ